MKINRINSLRYTFFNVKRCDTGRIEELFFWFCAAFHIEKKLGNIRVERVFST